MSLPPRAHCPRPSRRLVNAAAQRIKLLVFMTVGLPHTECDRRAWLVLIVHGWFSSTVVACPNSRAVAARSAGHSRPKHSNPGARGPCQGRTARDARAKGLAQNRSQKNIKTLRKTDLNTISAFFRASIVAFCLPFWQKSGGILFVGDTIYALQLTFQKHFSALTRRFCPPVQPSPPSLHCCRRRRAGGSTYPPPTLQRFPPPPPGGGVLTQPLHSSASPPPPKAIVVGGVHVWGGVQRAAAAA